MSIVVDGSHTSRVNFPYLLRIPHYPSRGSFVIRERVIKSIERYIFPVLAWINQGRMKTHQGHGVLSHNYRVQMNGALITPLWSNLFILIHQQSPSRSLDNSSNE